jgi:hypothetical protein
MRIIGLITYSANIRHIMERSGVPDESRPITPDWEEACQATPDLKAGQRISW